MEQNVLFPLRDGAQVIASRIFYLSNINAEVESVGKITYGKNFQLQDIHLTVKDKSRLRQTDNIDSKIEINYK